MDGTALSDLIERVYAAALTPAEWQEVMEGVAAAFRGTAVLFTQDTRDGRAEISLSADADPVFVRLYEQHYCFTNVWYERVRRVGSIIIEAVPPDLHRTEYYADFLRPQGLAACISTPLRVDGSRAMDLAVMRSSQRSEFEAREVEAWKRLVPHLLRAFDVQDKLHVAQLHTKSVLGILGGAQTGVILADADARVVFANTAGNRLLTAGRVLSAVGERLRAATPSATQALSKLICEAAGTGSGSRRGGTLSLPRRDRPPVSATISPLPTHDDRLFVSRPLAMVLVNDADRGGAIEPQTLERLYDLTPAQARLLVALVDGRRLADYAEEAGVSINTVKSHMKQIFEKTGENRQTDLVRRVLADPLSRRS